MLRTMKKKQTVTQSNTKLKLLTVLVLAAMVVSGLVGYRLAYQKYDPNKTPNQNTPGYITASEARDQVNNFYEQYLNPNKNSVENSRNITVEGFGSKNLVFYREYYQHGFDPIVCSAVMPTSVTATSVRPGPGAVVHATASYPDGSTADITLTEVLNNEGFKIDTITCPGDKGNLLPRH